MRGLASPHPILDAISWVISTSSSVLAVLFGVLVLLGSTVDSCSFASLRSLRAHFLRMAVVRAMLVLLVCSSRRVPFGRRHS